MRLIVLALAGFWTPFSRHQRLDLLELQGLIQQHKLPACPAGASE